MNDYLDNVHKKASAIRLKYYENTLPWGMEGTQLLPSANYLAFMSDFRKEKGEWEYLVNEFVSNYDQLRLDAKRILGSLYNDSDYPTANEIANKFRMDMAVFPVPTNDFRVQINDAELTRIQQDVEQRVKQAQSQAMQEVWQRLYDKVKHIAERLADPKAVFRDSMIENARELCALLPRLNFADDPNLESLRQQVELSLTNQHPDSLRNDPLLRSDKAAEAKSIMDAMSVFMGGTQ